MLHYPDLWLQAHLYPIPPSHKASRKVIPDFCVETNPLVAGEPSDRLDLDTTARKRLLLLIVRWPDKPEPSIAGDSVYDLP